MNLFNPKARNIFLSFIIFLYLTSCQSLASDPVHSVPKILKDIPVLSEQSIAIILPRHLVQDIDTEEDWLRAELLYKANQSYIESAGDE